MAKTVLITGCSSGIGKAAAQLFAARRWNVAATARPRGGSRLGESGQHGSVVTGRPDS
jgi:NAD(P)-dependent dehydrogenase (short-subunit alcohol dehydrogenase family)